MQLLWRGIAAYVFQNKIELMFGCASLPGIDPDALAMELTYLYHNHLAPAAIRPRALPHRYIEMRRLDREEIDARAALNRLPPLIKGYLRLGGFVGDGAVIDPQFNTTDVAVVVQTDLVTDKYYRHYERQTREGQEWADRRECGRASIEPTGSSDADAAWRADLACGFGGGSWLSRRLALARRCTSCPLC